MSRSQAGAEGGFLYIGNDIRWLEEGGGSSRNGNRFALLKYESCFSCDGRRKMAESSVYVHRETDLGSALIRAATELFLCRSSFTIRAESAAGAWTP